VKHLWTGWLLHPLTSENERGAGCMHRVVNAIIMPRPTPASNIGWQFLPMQDIGGRGFARTQFANRAASLLSPSGCPHSTRVPWNHIPHQQTVEGFGDGIGREAGRS
jgi:hypothetical protein